MLNIYIYNCIVTDNMVLSITIKGRSIKIPSRPARQALIWKYIDYGSLTPSISGYNFVMRNFRDFHI